MWFILEAFHNRWLKTNVNENCNDESTNIRQNRQLNFRKCCPPVDIAPDPFVSELDFLRSCSCSSLNKKVWNPTQCGDLCICMICVFVLAFLFGLYRSPGEQQAVVLGASWGGWRPGSSSSPATLWHIWPVNIWPVLPVTYLTSNPATMSDIWYF